MEEDNQLNNEPRKLRKIKRSRPLETPTGSFGMPAKINFVGADEEDTDYIGVSGNTENIHMVTEEDYQYEQGTIADYLKNKTVLLLLSIAVIFGMILGSMFMPKASGSDRRGLDGVVLNSDVMAGRSRCGLTEPHQGCVLYIMNPKNQEVAGKDFYSTAAKWTGRERYVIEMGNMHYGNVRIAPGYIAQINIPPLQ